MKCHLRETVALVLVLGTNGWVAPSISGFRHARTRLLMTSHFDESGLMEMDIVIFSRLGRDDNELGALQEDGRITPLAAWTDEPAYDSAMEFVVDEEDMFPGFTPENSKIISVLPESVIAYGSRQVGGGKGPKNPHGEESELLYYVDEEALDGVAIVLRPELDVFG